MADGDSSSTDREIAEALSVSESQIAVVEPSSGEIAEDFSYRIKNGAPVPVKLVSSFIAKLLRLGRSEFYHLRPKSTVRELDIVGLQQELKERVMNNIFACETAWKADKKAETINFVNIAEFINEQAAAWLEEHNRADLKKPNHLISVCKKHLCYKTLKTKGWIKASVRADLHLEPRVEHGFAGLFLSILIVYIVVSKKLPKTGNVDFPSTWAPYVPDLDNMKADRDILIESVKVKGQKDAKRARQRMMAADTSISRGRSSLGRGLLMGKTFAEKQLSPDTVSPSHADDMDDVDGLDDNDPSPPPDPKPKRMKTDEPTDPSNLMDSCIKSFTAALEPMIKPDDSPRLVHLESRVDALQGQIASVQSDVSTVRTDMSDIKSLLSSLVKQNQPS